MTWLANVLKSGAFWGALLFLIAQILFAAIPDFPVNIWVAIDALIVSILLSQGIEVVRLNNEVKELRRGIERSLGTKR